MACAARSFPPRPARRARRASPARAPRATSRSRSRYANTSWRTQLTTSFAVATVAAQRRDRALRVRSQTGYLDENPRVLRTDPPLLHVTRALRGGKLGHRRAHPVAHLLRRLDRNEIGFGEVAVVVRLFLRTTGDRATLLLVPVPRLLHDLLAGLRQRPLPFGLVVDRTQQRTQRVEVLDLGARPELRRPRLPHRHVRVDAQRSLFHLHVGDTDREQRGAQLFDVALRLLGRSDVGLRHDLEQRHPGAVVVDEREVGVVDATADADVLRLARVLFEVRARDADAYAVDVEPAVDRDRLVVLRRLIVLRHVGIEVVLAREHRTLGHAQMQRLGDAQRVLDGRAVEHRQRAGQTQAHRAHVRVGLVAELVRAPAEHLARGGELAVHLEADHRLVARHRLRHGCQTTQRDDRTQLE